METRISEELARIFITFNQLKAMRLTSIDVCAWYVMYIAHAWHEQHTVFVQCRCFVGV